MLSTWGFVVLKALVVAGLFTALPCCFSKEMRHWRRRRQAFYFGASLCVWLVVFGTIALNR